MRITERQVKPNHVLAIVADNGTTAPIRCVQMGAPARNAAQDIENQQRVVERVEMRKGHRLSNRLSRSVG